jgi:hypothetical protein
MAGLDRTMRAARRLPPADVPTPAAVPAPAAAPAPAPAAPQVPETWADRLKRLDSNQLEQVVAALRGNWALPAERDDEYDEALRQSLADYVEEWADDVVEENAGDPEARDIGREQAVGFIEEEIERVLAESAPTEQATDG